MSRSLGGFVGILGLAAAIGGCAIQELQEETRQGQQRVEQKQGTLDALERTQAELAAQRDRLRADLQQREMTAAQLRDRLEQMRSLNESAPVRTPEQRQQRERRSRQLDDAARRAQALERDATLSRQEKARRLEALKKETDAVLRLLLAG